MFPAISALVKSGMARNCNRVKLALLSVKYRAYLSEYSSPNSGTKTSVITLTQCRALYSMVAATRRNAEPYLVWLHDYVDDFWRPGVCIFPILDWAHSTDDCVPSLRQLLRRLIVSHQRAFPARYGSTVSGSRCKLPPMFGQR
jgi:hypothetical protein